MIQQLNPQEFETAKKIYQTWQASYAIEAALLDLNFFPPLIRTIENFQASKTNFYGFYKAKEIAGIIEIESLDDVTEIHSLVVNPDYFRQGVASALMQFALQQPTNNFIVETAAENQPAINLYRRFGFEIVKEWMLDIGIMKVQLKKLGLDQ